MAVRNHKPVRALASCLCGSCVVIPITHKGAALSIIVPAWAPLTCWGVNNKGYAHHTYFVEVEGQKKKKRKAMYAQRLVMVHLQGMGLGELHVHHQDSDKLNNCPLNLILMPPELNPTGAQRCAYTGRYLASHQVQALQARQVRQVRQVQQVEERKKSESESEVPDWVSELADTEYNERGGDIDE